MLGLTHDLGGLGLWVFHLARSSAPRLSSNMVENKEKMQLLYEDPYNLEVIFKKGTGTMAYPLEEVAGKAKLCWLNDDGIYVESGVPVGMAAVKRRPASRVVGKQKPPQDCYHSSCA